jgi:[NiFe] hydrogenase assembly HybE family chaperone
VSGFEGSFLGALDKISPQAIMECKICWTPYDPTQGDDYRQVEAGTAFLDLPQDWSCPNCSAPKEQFMVLEDPGSTAAAETLAIEEATGRLMADFREIWHAKMRDVPMVNKMLSVEAVGFRMYEGRPLGVLLSPWFMNLVVLPGEDEDWSALIAGEKEVIGFPSGEYEFIHNTRELTGGYKACSLFSMMGDFQTQIQAVEVAEAVMRELFKESNRAETDRAADIRQAREAELVEHAQEAELQSPSAAPTRRAVISGGLSDAQGSGHQSAEDA